MTQACAHCKAIYPAYDKQCIVCREPSPLWEKQELARIMDENMGDEAAWMLMWTGASSNP